MFPGVKEFGLFDVFQRVWKTGKSEHHPITLYKDNWIEGWRENYVYKLPSGEIVAVYEDVTERKKAEQKLKESESNLNAILDHTHMLVAYMDKYFNFLRVNRTYAEADDRDVSFFPGKNHFDLYPHAENEEIFKNVVKTGESYFTYAKPFDYAEHPGRGISYWDWSLTPLKDYKGAVKALVLTLQNVSDRIEVEQKLKESEKKYRNLFETSPSAIILLDLEGQIVDINIATESLFGYSKEELIDKKFLNLGIYYNDALQKVSEKFELIVKGEELRRLEVQLKKKDRTLMWVMIRASLIKFGNDILIQAIMHDITERKNAEQELRRINQLKTELLERTSHEFKTPLISIKGFTDLLLDLYREKFDSNTVSILGEIQNGTKRLQTLINNLLVSSHLESGKVDFKPIKEDLSFLIRFCVKDLHGLAKTRNHFIRLDIPDKLILRFEKEKIYEVISNLLINAIKYTPPFGEIKIKLEPKDDLVIVSVEDNGIGLTENEKKRIFKQFGKIERYGQGWDIGIEGTGMGLYTSKIIVKMHGGEIWVESEGRNKGSKFCFSLPISKH